MKVRLDTVLASQQAFNTLLGTAIPAKTAYWLAKVAKQIAKELDQFNSARSVLINQLGTEDPEVKGKFTVPEDKMPEFTEKVTPLLVVEIDILPELSKPFVGVKLDDLNNVMISPAVLAALDWLIVE